MTTERQAQNRAEELLLELVLARVLADKPDDPKTLSDDEQSERYKGYYEGWWDCLETLSQTIDAHNEGNRFRR